MDIGDNLTTVILMFIVMTAIVACVWLIGREF